MNTYQDKSPVFSRTPAVRRDFATVYADAAIKAAALAIRARIAEMIGMFPAEATPNSYYGHTQDGLVLACDYGVPNSLFTPWGQLPIHRGGSCKEPQWLQRLEDLKLAEVAPRMYVDNPLFGGEKGPLYTIGNFNGPLTAACFDLQAVCPPNAWRGSLCFDLQLESMRGKTTLEQAAEVFGVDVECLLDARDEECGHISITRLRSLIIEARWNALEAA